MKQWIVSSVAAAFLLLASIVHAGQEPDAMVYVMTGAAQPSQIGWDIQGQSQASVTSALSLAAVHCMA